MMTRFENANDVGHFLADEATRQLTEAIDTSVFPEKRTRLFYLILVAIRKRGGYCGSGD